MKLTLPQLRKIIREEANRVLTEAPFEDILPPIDLRGDKSDAAFLRAHNRFHSTPLYKAKAVNSFKEFPFPVYILPIATDGAVKHIRNGYGRIQIYDPEAGLALIDGAVYDIEHLRKQLSSGAAIFVSETTELYPGQLPTPWMMIHAIFDADMPGIFKKEFKKISDTVNNFIGRNYDTGEVPDIVDFMTMGSVRKGELDNNTPSDVVAEIITQAILDSRGFILAESSEDGVELPDEFKAFRDLVNGMNLKGKFHELVSGKVVFIEVAP